ncbi:MULTISPECIES: hypothetical protein [Legionella]|uniref:Uncharacterized protein n=1 Tax=Legionella drozanskii LLAP-1 TaxID=1212489 RepID=A0A0W0T102_9GAMM|nr:MULTISPECIES: hypothetical protein [Legionella]KTC89242.1 hypothetical protein Ldro_0731 [Legionella drozanskii LLAP-1]PJE13392.1 MAG: hypothetical protein CK430_06450 [Legionella sp.]
MRTFFSSFSANNKEAFTTQREILEKYGLAVNDQGEVVGMCRPMTNTYLSLILQGEKPKKYLEDGKKFLANSIERENRELEAAKLGETDIDHSAFKENNVPHVDLILPKNHLTEATVTALLEKNKHLLITYPQDKADHEIYLGRKNEAGRCRFFDANIRGGERKGRCDELIHQVVEAMKSQYTKEDKPFGVGMG